MTGEESTDLAVAREAEEVAWRAYVDGGRTAALAEAYDAACKATDVVRGER